MTVTNFMVRQTKALENMLASCCTKPEPPYVTPEQTALDRFTIAVSHEIGTPALEVARQVGERLGWPVYDREIAARIAQELRVPVAVVEAIDERRQSWLLECLESFHSRCLLSESRYFRHLISVVRSLGEQGRCLIVGHGAEFLLPPHSTLRVCLVGNREDRIAAFGCAGHIDHWTAARRLDQLNRERSRFIREHFHVEPNQPHNYDLILNTSQWPSADCADFIVRALHRKATEHLKN
jgi:hypothetical protein